MFIFHICLGVLIHLLITFSKLAYASSAPALANNTSINYYHVCSLDHGCIKSQPIPLIDHKATTQYPLLLVHGFLGSTIIPKNGFNYWGKIPETLAAHGADVYLIKQSALNSSEIRGEQLIQQMKLISQLTSKEKLNLVGHSQGGQSVRYALSNIPQMISSVTTIGAPHLGSPAADKLVDQLNQLPINKKNELLKLANKIGTKINRLSGSTDEANYPQDILAALGSLTSKGAALFNEKYPAGLPTSKCGDGPETYQNILLYSWAGTKALSHPKELNDFLLLPTDKWLMPKANMDSDDGLVERCSSHFGKVINDHYPWNHLDEIDIFTGNKNQTELNATSVMLQHTEYLKEQGL